MVKNPVKTTLIFGFVLLGLANAFVAILTFFVKTGKYGLNDLWQNPDSFALGTSLIALICFGASYWFYQKK